MAAFAVCLLATVSAARGGVVLELTTASNLLNLTAGDIVMFDVLLRNDAGPSGDPLNPALSALITQVDFDATLLGTPTMTAGPIVPSPDNGALTLGPGPGTANFVFDLLFASPMPDLIRSQGILFSFQVTVPNGVSGSGIVSLSLPGTAAFDESGAQVVVPLGMGLDFQVVPNSAVPEPVTLAVWSLLGGLGVSCRFRCGK